LGEKHAEGNGSKRYQRSTTKTRTAVTTAGDHQFSLSYVKGTAATDDENTHFRPIEQVVDFNGKKRYQQDIAVRTVYLATTLSYRDAAAQADELERTPSKDTIRSRIAQTKERIEKTAWQLEQLSSSKAASYLRRGLDSMVTFAEYATDGFRCCGSRTLFNEQWVRTPSGASVTGCDGARRD